MGDYDAAIELHKAILDVHPTYVDCYLCLGYLVRDSRHNNEANQWFQHARAIGERMIHIFAVDVQLQKPSPCYIHSLVKQILSTLHNY